MRARCDDCRRVWDADELNEPKDLMQRLDPGGVVPAGECPACGALAYPLKDEADHYVILVGYVPEGEEHVEPIALHDGLYESEEYALGKKVLLQAVGEVLANVSDPELWDLKHAHPERFVVRVGAVRFGHDHHPFKKEKSA